jgi:hypothetical protein
VDLAARVNRRSGEFFFTRKRYASLGEFEIRSRDSTWIRYRLHSLFEFQNIHHSDPDAGNAVENHSIIHVVGIVSEVFVLYSS